LDARRLLADRELDLACAVHVALAPGGGGVGARVGARVETCVGGDIGAPVFAACRIRRGGCVVASGIGPDGVIALLRVGGRRIRRSGVALAVRLAAIGGAVFTTRPVRSLGVGYARVRSGHVIGHVRALAIGGGIDGVDGIGGVVGGEPIGAAR
jgi:hypothetical protein